MGKNQLPEGLVYPTESFEDFYFRFKNTKEIVQDPQWINIYSSYYELSPCEMDIPVR
jgi:hypothetical protein